MNCYTDCIISIEHPQTYLSFQLFSLNPLAFDQEGNSSFPFWRHLSSGSKHLSVVRWEQLPRTIELLHFAQPQENQMQFLRYEMKSIYMNSKGSFIVVQTKSVGDLRAGNGMRINMLKGQSVQELAFGIDTIFGGRDTPQQDIREKAKQIPAMRNGAKHGIENISRRKKKCNLEMRMELNIQIILRCLPEQDFTNCQYVKG